MKSLWKVTYIGSHTSVFIKKLDRYLKVKSNILLKERYDYDGNNYERVVFEIEHPYSKWNESVCDVLRMASLISIEWKAHIFNSSSHILGLLNTNEREEKGGFLIEGPSGLAEISWELKLDQQYSVDKLSGEHKC